MQLRRLAPWLALAPMVALAACAGRSSLQRPDPARPSKGDTQSQRPQLDVSGVWDWVYRSSSEQGDLRIEQEEWHLSQEGTRLSGYYDREVVTLSTDQRPFRCNGALGYTRTTRVKVAGHIEGERIILHEIAADAQEHPCDNGVRSLMSYVGELQGGFLRLQFGSGGQQVLTRRAPGVRMAGIGRSSSGGDPQPISGVWEWELSTVDAEGDLRVESEEWHLEESQLGITGYYQRTVRRQRPGGVFSCNGRPTIVTSTQYTIRGHRIGDRVSLSEVDFKAQPDPCDNGLRRLDTYHGSLSPTGQELLLSWGSGSQMLRRRP
ncbi:MAG: hypothetical protein RMK29_14165 [Myxococcales bacterium]|nr:hypothetical protein [Myxococcota bacterium]MDW8282856.1 hypothetical protein [Myxococcales bacterium]